MKNPNKRVFPTVSVKSSLTIFIAIPPLPLANFGKLSPLANLPHLPVWTLLRSSSRQIGSGWTKSTVSRDQISGARAASCHRTSPAS